MTVTVAVLGAGSRGSAYARYAERFPDRATVVAVADPRAGYRDALGDRHALPPAARFTDWTSLAAAPRCADAVLVTTPDREHVAPVLAFAEQGYDILLEKPMAPTEEGCAAIVDAVRRTGVLLAVCHVMRYTAYTETVKRLVGDGAVGRIVGVEHLEPVGWRHFSHSFVRGNWRRADLSSPILLAKCCHDLDWLRYIVDAPPVSVSSVGALHHFHAGERPAGAADRCLDCAVEPQCAYSAKRYYADCLANPARHVWPLSVVTQDLTEAGVRAALREGPYGRCVYASDNDVVDHQVVTATFETGATATLTMSAFTPGGHRRTRIMGTRGHLEGDGDRLTLTDFVTGEVSTVEVPVRGADAGSAHGGGDFALMAAFVAAVGSGDRALVRSGPEESLDSHRMAFAAERSRLAGGVPVALAAASDGARPRRISGSPLPAESG